MDALGGRALLCRRFEPMNDVNTLDDENAIAAFFHLAPHIGREITVVSIDFARLQRATQGAEQSTGNRGHQVINGGGVRFAEVGRIHAIVGGNRAMHAEDHRIFFSRKSGKTHRSHFSFDVRL